MTGFSRRQGFGGLHLHGTAGGNTDTDAYHQGYQDKRGGGTKQQAVPFQCRSVMPGIQFILGKYNVDNDGRYRHKDEEEQAFGHKPAKNISVGSSQRLMQGYFGMPLLGTEPEGSQQAQEDVKQEEAHAYDVVTQFVGVGLLVIPADIHKTTYIAAQSSLSALIHPSPIKFKLYNIE